MSHHIGSASNFGFFMWTLHVLPLKSSFLPESKNVHIYGESEKPCMCVNTAMRQ